MGAKVLEDLKSDEFELSVGFLSTASALRRVLSRTGEIAAVRQALKEGAITGDTIRQFVSVLMRDLCIGQRLPYEIAIAALAVALETRATDFAEEYLHDLSRLKLAEMSLCIRVARECLKHRRVLSPRSAKVVDCRIGDEEVPFSIEVCQPPLKGNGSTSGNTFSVCEVT